MITTGPTTSAPGPPDMGVSMHQIARARMLTSIAKHKGAHPLLVLAIANQEHKLGGGSHAATMACIHALGKK